MRSMKWYNWPSFSAAPQGARKRAFYSIINAIFAIIIPYEQNGYGIIGLAFRLPHLRAARKGALSSIMTGIWSLYHIIA